MNGFIDLVLDIVHANGLEDAEIKLKRRLCSPPGCYCPAKSWDMLVLNRGKLIAAIEFKSQMGRSINDDCGDAVALAVDLWAAYRKGAFGEKQKAVRWVFDAS